MTGGIYLYIGKRYGLLILLVFTILSGVMVHAEVKSNLFVTDDGGMLSEHDETYIETLLSTIEKQSTIEFAVVTVESLYGKSIESVAQSTFQSMGLGKSDKNNGLLLIISSEDRRYRLEVGYGLEGIITDTVASYIIKELKTPFRNEEYDRGIKEAIFKTVDYLNSSGLYIIDIKKYVNASKHNYYPQIITFVVVVASLFLINKLKSKKKKRSYLDSYDYLNSELSEDSVYHRDRFGRYISDSVHRSSKGSDKRMSSDSSSYSSSDSSGFGGGDSGGGGSSGSW